MELALLGGGGVIASPAPLAVLAAIACLAGAVGMLFWPEARPAAPQAAPTESYRGAVHASRRAGAAPSAPLRFGAAPEPVRAEVLPPASPVLVGIDRSPGRAAAYLRDPATGKTVRAQVGQVVGGWTVRNITRDTVRMSNGDDVVALGLFTAMSASRSG